MNSVANYVDSMSAIGRFLLKSSFVVGIFTLLTACAGFTPSVGISVPIGGMGGVGVSVGGNGTVSGSVGVGVGGGSVSVGGSGQLPKPAEKKPETEAEKKEEKKP
jgi:hypothetical protein